MAPEFQPENETKAWTLTPTPGRVPLSIPLTLVPGEIFQQSVALQFLRTQQVASPDSSSPRAGSHAGIGVIWNVGQPLVAWPEADADGPTHVVVVRGGRDALRSTESKKRGWERGIWRIPHSLQSHPTLLQTQDCVRTSKSRPVLALYLRVPAPNHALHGILIGVDSGTHDQLTRRDTSGQREADSRSTRSTSAPQ